MSSLAKEYATEIDCKVRQIRKKAATFAYGCITEDSSKVEPAKQLLAAEQKELTQIESQCADFVKDSVQLGQLLQEADETASKIYARLSEIYADFGLEMPTIDEDDLPVGMPIERLIPKKEKLSEEQSDVAEEPSEVKEELSASQLSSDEDINAADLMPNIVISRPSDYGGPPTWTPMIKVKTKQVTVQLANK